MIMCNNLKFELFKIAYLILVEPFCFKKCLKKNIYIKTDKPSAISSTRELDLKSKEKE